MDTVSVTEFKAKCLAIIEHVRRTGRPIVVTKNGQPAVDLNPHRAPTVDWRPGRCAHTVTRIGDIVSPSTDPGEWDMESKWF